VNTLKRPKMNMNKNETQHDKFNLNSAVELIQICSSNKTHRKLGIFFYIITVFYCMNISLNQI
jgi:hypothetical protein